VLGKEDESRLIRNRRLVLLVDLDQTLIHTTNENIAPNIKDVYHFQVSQLSFIFSAMKLRLLLIMKIGLNDL